MLSKYILVVVFVFSNVFIQARTEIKNDINLDNARRLVGLIDYISSDYKGAVRNGTIVDDFEYNEMQEFCQLAIKLFALSFEANNSQILLLKQKLNQLQQLVNRKQEPTTITAVCSDLKNDLVRFYALPVTPSQLPDLVRGKKLYQENCVSCHGVDGNGKGPLAQQLKPKPRSFLEEDFVLSVSPFKVYNTLVVGIPGTAMVSFSKLKSFELWDLSFYLTALYYENQVLSTQALPMVEKDKLFRSNLSLELLTMKDNAYFTSWLREHSFDRRYEKDLLRVLRTSLSLWGEVPTLNLDVKENKGSKSNKPFKYAYALLGIEHTLKSFRQVKEYIVSKQYSKIEGLVLDAYLDGFEKAEIQLKLLDKDLVTTIEKEFMTLRQLSMSPENLDFMRQLNALENMLLTIQIRISEKKGASVNHWGEFITSLTIILREGFEAFLVIMMLLSLVKSLGFVRARLWIHIAWVLAIVAGVITYFVIEELLNQSGLARELLEALCTGAAVIVLFYTGFWVLSQGERQHWGQLITTKTKQALTSRQLWWVFLLAFIAVYREAAETVLFYRALFSSVEHSYTVTLGFFSGVVLLLFICSAIIKFNMKLPMKLFFQATSCIMFTLSIILAGKTARELVETGYLPYNVLGEYWSIDFLGIYSLRETILAQLLLIVLGLLVGFYMYRKKMSIHQKTSL